MAAQNPYYSIVPCCPFYGTSSTSFSVYNLPGEFQLGGTFVYNGINQIINGLNFVQGACYTLEYLGANTETYPLVNADNFTLEYTACTESECISDICNLYKLTDCQGNLYGITYQDLSAYLGKTIRIAEDCDKDDVCVTVEICADDICKESVLIGAISIVDVYEHGCEECNTNCYCTTIQNNDSVAHIYNYLDCDRTLQTVTVESLQTSSKLCVYRFVGDDCYCVNIIVNGHQSTVALLPYKVNNHNAYIANTVIGILYLVYNTTTNQWVLSKNILGDQVIAYLSEKDETNCPTGTWTIISDMTVTYSNPDAFVQFTNLNFDFVNSGLYTATYEGYSLRLRKFEFSPEACIFYLEVYLPESDTWYAFDQFQVPECCLFGEYTSEETGGILTVINLCSLTTSSCGSDCPAYIPKITDVFTQYTECNDNTCAPLCYSLTNCVTEEVIYSNSQTLYSYLGELVTLLGYDGCWTVSETIESNCDSCAVNIIVLNICAECTPYIGYKLTRCDNNYITQYSENPDLADYIGKVIVSDCGNCWSVEQIDYKPETVTNVVIDFSFNTCAECLANYYKLVDCNQELPDLYTSTDLSGNVGSVITIENCDTCWTVETTNRPVNPVKVVPIDSFIDCDSCNATVPCVCSTMTNYDSVAHTYYYLDCNRVTQTIILQPNETSNRLCLIKWFAPSTCDCILWSYTDPESGLTQNIAWNLTGNIVNGHNEYLFNISEDNYYLRYIDNQWVAYAENDAVIIYTLSNSKDLICPIGEWIPVSPDIDIDYTATTCPSACNCLELTYTNIEGFFTIVALPTGNVINNEIEYYWTNIDGPDGNNIIKYSGTRWEIYDETNTLIAHLNVTGCPTGNWIIDSKEQINISTTICSSGIGGDFLPTDNIVYYGDCLNGQCPPIIYPKAKIKPGYTTPTCDTEKYEKITCKSSEILYKQVLTLRYGISNCCPDEDDKWLIKKELIDLQAAVDPDYICTPANTCCNNTPTCGCGCNTVVKTCNS